MARISFTEADTNFKIKKKRSLAAFILAIFEAEKKSCFSLDYVICSDEYLLEINKSYLNHDYYTDIITFDLSIDQETAIIGEIYISVDRVKDNATHYKNDFTEELLRVIFHGVLHLCGYKDKRKREITIMRQKEDHYLRLFDENTSQ